ncbi:hypothetical protein [Streptomyces sp. NPDC088847]|uniref:hypothetical protein n=1 Tax=Streptomyces sp. NPDC088847 TaxID=3365909 RepID=UPI003830F698
MGYRAAGHVRAGICRINDPEKNVSPARTTRPGPPEPHPFMTLHTAVVLLTAVIIGLVVGGLSYLSGTPLAGAVLTGLLSAGGSVPVLHHLIR